MAYTGEFDFLRDGERALSFSHCSEAADEHTIKKLCLQKRYRQFSQGGLQIPD